MVFKMGSACSVPGADLDIGGGIALEELGVGGFEVLVACAGFGEVGVSVKELLRDEALPKSRVGVRRAWKVVSA